MQNIIFGSGVVGLLAKTILGPSWKVIPFYRSRFFSYQPSLDDNFIIRDVDLDEFIKDVSGLDVVPIHVYRRAWSIAGNLVRSWDSGLCKTWLAKLFANAIPSQSEIYLSTRMDLMVYGGVKVNQLYAKLLEANLPSLKEEALKGQITEVGDHYFIRNGIREEFDLAVSTIPADALFKLMKLSTKDLQFKTIHYLHVETNELNFEGNNQVLVVDPFSFYKVTNIAPGRYLFQCHENIQNPGIYLMHFMKIFDTLDGTSVINAIPMGEMLKTDLLNKSGIYCVGSNAQMDWCADVGSNILRLLRLAQRSFKSKPQIIAS